MKKVKGILSISLIVVICLTASLLAREPDNFVRQNTPYLAKTAITQVTRTMSNISNWGYWMYHTGQSAITPLGSSGGLYPRGTAGAIFADGFVWGGKVGDEIRVGGVTYNIGTQPGWIEADGTECDKEDPRVKIWRIRPDYETLTYDMVRRDAMEVNGLTSQADVSDAMCQAIIDQYAEDWENWPSELGAPVYEDGTPGIANADQVVWFVCNDLDETATAGLYGSDPIGLELQVTAWAYAQPGASLGQIVFKKYKFTNRSGGTITDFYVSQWCDPDLGNAGDDLVGCDTTLSMGYVYNGGDTDDDYAAFGLAPAAVGYDFFQGPLLEGVAGEDRNKNGVDDAEDYAVFDLKVVGPGKINLPMTTFGWFAAGSEISDPTLQDYEGTLQWYNMLKGYVPTDNIDNPTPWYEGNNPALAKTVYPLAGDPVTQTGDVDGTYELNLSPSDRRMCLTSGPFDFPDGGVQEVVVAVVGGLGDTRFSSIEAMKNTDIVAQTLYDGAFAGVPKAPKVPKVTTRAFEDYVVLEWGSDADAVEATEDPIIAGYAFEGYNVYQLPNPASSKEESELIATYDLVNGVETIHENKFVAEYGQIVEVPVQFGADVGVKRSFVIEKDYLTGDPLYEGNTYYFAVTAYNYNAAPELIEAKALESALIASPVVVQEPLPGTKYTSEAGETVEYEHTAGNSDGLMEVLIVDPNAVTGNNYEVFFTADEDTNSATYGETLWNVRNATLTTTVVSDQLQIADMSASDDQPIFDGLKVKVSGPAPGINLNIDGPYGYYPGAMGYNTTGGTRWVSWPTNWGLETMFGALGNGFSFFGSDCEPTDYVDVELRFAGCTDRSETTSEGLMAASKLEYPECWGKGVVYRRDLGYAVQSQLADIPFTVWDTEATPPRQLKVAIVEDAREDVGNGNFIWDMGWNGSEFSAMGGREYVFIINDTYDEQYTEYLNENLDGTYNNVMYAAGWGTRGYPYLEDAFEIQIFASNVIIAGEDVFTFTAPSVEESEDLAKDAVKKVNVFPNPYYAYNALSTNRFDNYVTFTHLPAKATIRIFTLAGIQVRVLEKDSPNTQFLRWDLLNESDLPVASGMYIAYIDMPDLNKNKVLKLVIVQNKQILEYY